MFLEVRGSVIFHQFCVYTVYMVKPNDCYFHVNTIGDKNNKPDNVGGVDNIRYLESLYFTKFDTHSLT